MISRIMIQMTRGLTPGMKLKKVEFPGDYNVTHRFNRLYAVQLMKTVVNRIFTIDLRCQKEDRLYKV